MHHLALSAMQVSRSCKRSPGDNGWQTDRASGVALPWD